MYDEEYQKRKAFWRIIFWTFSFIGILTGLNALFIINSLGRGIFKPVKRQIASLETIHETKVVKPAPPVIEVSCIKRTPIQITTLASTARLSFRNCEQIIHLKNLANRGRGDVFPTAAKQWTSDFIMLKIGENQIQAKFHDHYQTIKIIRETPKIPVIDKAL